MHKTSASPLVLAYTALIIYASLYPFTPWRGLGLSPLSFLMVPPPKGPIFDTVINLMGYGPFGFLLCLSLLRTRPSWPAMPLATLVAGLVSLLMESLQTYLPGRVPSTLDLLLNVVGAGLGAGLASGLERLGAIDRWSILRARWFVIEARGALVLLALWPVALLFPASVPLGLGQVLERLKLALSGWRAEVPWLAWLPGYKMHLLFLSPTGESLCVALGALVPCLLAYSVTPEPRHRMWLAAGAWLLGLGVSVLSMELSYGPTHAWSWLTLSVQVGLWAALVLALVLLRLPAPSCAGLALPVLLVHLGLVNSAPIGGYLAQTLQTWELGRLIHFYGLAQWLGWLWPYAVLVYLALRLLRRNRQT